MTDKQMVQIVFPTSAKKQFRNLVRDAHKVEKFPTTRLTQAQLDAAFAEPGRPPQLNGVLDDQTGSPLVWHD